MQMKPSTRKIGSSSHSPYMAATSAGRSSIMPDSCNMRRHSRRMIPWFI